MIHTASYTYDGRGNIVKQKEDLYQGRDEAVITEREYDCKNRVTNEKITNADGGTVAETNYEYDGRGNVKKKTCRVNGEESLVEEYKYDGAGRLTKVTDDTRTAVYGYDKAGNRTTLTETAAKTETVGGNEIFCTAKTTSYLYSDSNRLLSVSELYESSEGTEAARKIVRYVYDGAGNEISHTAEYLFPQEEATEEYGLAAGDYDSVVEVTINEYNGLNQLVNMTSINNGSRSSVNYGYNGDGLRVSKAISGTEYDGNYMYFYSGSSMVGMSENGNTVDAMYIGAFGVAEMEYANGDKEYNFANAHGDVINTVDANGNVLNAFEYDEFGNLTKCEEILNKYS